MGGRLFAKYGRVTAVGVVALAVAAAIAVALWPGTRASRARHAWSGRFEARRGHVSRTPSSRHDPIAGPLQVDVLKTLRSAESRCEKPPPVLSEQPLSHRQWLSGVTITEYYPAPERWFIARRIKAPGLPGVYAADWLYSARGLAMEGDGVDRDGRPVHIADLGATGWVNAAGEPTAPVCLGKWSNGFPVWLIGGWRNGRGAVTFPLSAGGWANGRGVKTVPYGGVSFAAGFGTPLRYYHSIAVDPKLIPLGSRVYVPAYSKINGGWFVAQDTGGAIDGRHIDVYRPAPASPDNLGRYMTGQRILVVPPGDGSS